MTPNKMRWVPIDGKNFPPTKRPHPDAEWKEWRGLLWCDDPDFPPQARMGRFSIYDTGHEYWQMDGTSGHFSITHYCEIVSPFVYVIQNENKGFVDCIYDATDCADAVCKFAAASNTTPEAVESQGWSAKRINR